MTAADDQTIRELAGLAGIQLGYRNALGQSVETSLPAIARLLAVLGFPTDTPEAVAGSRARLEARWNAPVPKLIVAEAGKPQDVAIHSNAGKLSWRIEDETGAFIDEGTLVDSGEFLRLTLPALPASYFVLHVTIGDERSRSTIISAPPACWRLKPPRRLWGLAGPAYGLSSEHDLGIGDFSDIGRIAKAAAARGASFLTLSPLHALFSADRAAISPYSPSSRLFLDPIYIDPAAIPGLEEDAAAIVAALDREDVIASARAGDLVDYPAVWKVKRYVLGELWRLFEERGGDCAFDAFRARQGDRLAYHARFEAKANRKDDAEPDESEVSFHAWLQWLADRQLAAAEAYAKAGGMALGLFADLAVGATAQGSEFLSDPGSYIAGASIGAPPDELAPQGQDWGLIALSPLAMEETGLAAFRALIAANMRHIAGIRIDHAFQLTRLYLIPGDGPASEGAYLAYPSEAMFAVLRMESHRARCVVIGEDLGTPPPNFSEILHDYGGYGYRVLYFERQSDGGFKPPSAYTERALAVIATHDMATFEGWWHGHDIGVRIALGIIGAEEAERNYAERQTDRQRLVALLASEQLLADANPPEDAPFEAIARLLGRNRAEMVSFQLDDLAGATEQQNVPGIVEGTPNWRRRLPMTIEQLAARGGPLDRFSEAMIAEGRWPSTTTQPTGGKMAKATKPRKPATKASTETGVVPDGAGRVVIEAVEPMVDLGRRATKAIVGDWVVVSADIFTDGHDKVGAEILYRSRGETAWRRAPMRAAENDRWIGSFPAHTIGHHDYTIEAWRDPFRSWVEEVGKKRAAGQVIALEIIEGRALVDRAVAIAEGEAKRAVETIRSQLEGVDIEAAWRVLSAAETEAAVATSGLRNNVSRYPQELPLWVDRRMARFSAWYELFPRSAANDPNRHGTFDDVIARLPYVRDLGFDVLYFPPIHPIGSTNRKGKNNSLTAEPGDPGSVYAIGAEAGGHDAIHPELGSLDDFKRLVAAAREHGLEIALDFAIQCSPDHPWIKEHPEWFDWRPDGTLKFAENPPKKYEDIVNVHFYGEALPSLWYALRDAVLFWLDAGVKIFRVDNPHTKPLPFWEWLIAEVNARDPEVLFLAEAFTRPKMMKRLAKIGFQQSYTYFTWRETKADLATYVGELSGEMANYYRPNFFTNTPDINPVYLQTSGRPGFLARATLASTLSSNWGIYSGFELCEAEPLPGREEYLDSEKYELRARDFDAPGNIRDHIAALNRIRRENPALQDFRNTEFINAWNDNVIAYFRATEDRSNALLVMVNLDPHHSQAADYEVPLWEFGLDDGATIAVEDLLMGYRFTLTGKIQRIALDNDDRQAVIWRLSR